MIQGTKFFFYVAFIALPLLVLFIFPKWTVDDAYIYYRYADNFAGHGELNWNIGQRPPLEGYTGVVLPVILAGFIKLGFSPITTSHAIGIVGFGLGELMLWLILRRLKLGAVGQTTGLFFYATTPILFTHVFSGLETTLFFGLMLASVYALLLAIQPKGEKPAKDTLLLIILLSLTLTRPEGLALSGLFMLTAAYIRLKNSRREFLMFALAVFFVYALPLGIYFYWRFSYYGALLPNTFYAKTGEGFQLANLMDLARFLIRYFAAPLAAGILLIGTDLDLLWKKIKASEMISALDSAWLVGVAYLAFIAALIVQFSFSHLTMNFAYRFYLPILPGVWIFLAILFDWGGKIMGSIKLSRPLTYKFIIATAAITFSYQFAFHVVKLKEEINFAREYKIILDNEHVSIGKFLKTNVPPSEWLAVFIEAGAMPYFSGLKTIDFGNLNDKYLTQHKTDSAKRVDYFYEHNPGAAVFTSEDQDQVGGDSDAEAVINDPRFKNYVLVKKYLSPLARSKDYRNFNEFLFLRKDLADKLTKP